MPTGRVTWFFEAGKYGWTETLWKPYQTDLNELRAVTEAYAAFRLPLCGTGVVMPAARISDDTIFLDSRLVPLNYYTAGGGGGTIPSQVNNSFGPPIAVTPAVAEPPDNPYSAVYVRMESTSLYRRIMYIRGLPDSVIVFPGGPTNQAAWNNAFSSYAAHVKAQWFFRVTNRTGAGQRFGVIRVQAGPPSTFTAPGAGLALVDQVQLKGFRGFKDVRIKGFISNVAGGDVYQIAGWTTLSNIFVQKGYVQKIVAPVYGPIDAIAIRGETHRKTGRPSTSPVGRSKVKAS